MYFSYEKHVFHVLHNWLCVMLLKYPVCIMSCISFMNGIISWTKKTFLKPFHSWFISLIPESWYITHIWQDHWCWWSMVAWSHVLWLWGHVFWWCSHEFYDRAIEFNLQVYEHRGPHQGHNRVHGSGGTLSWITRHFSHVS